ncbi:hypothetical protein D3C80_1935200 [compost metagenome]
MLHREAKTVSKVENIAGAAAAQICYRADMGIGEIADMNVVAYTGSILGRIVVSEDSNALPLAQCCLQYQGNQMALRTVVFTDFAAVMSARSVKVAECHIFDT